MKTRLQFVLPLFMGMISLPLMVWDAHNQAVILRMGMAWDTGAPLWPYQTPDILLSAMNVPAVAVSTGVSNLLSLDFDGWLRRGLIFACILLLWWGIGKRLDDGWWKRPARRTVANVGTFLLLAIALWALGVEESVWTFRWWWTYSRTLFTVADLILLRSLAPSLWCWAFGFGLSVKVVRTMRLGQEQANM